MLFSLNYYPVNDCFHITGSKAVIFIYYSKASTFSNFFFSDEERIRPWHKRFLLSFCIFKKAPYDKIKNNKLEKLCANGVHVNNKLVE